MTRIVLQVLAIIALVAWVMAFFRTLLNLALVPRLRAGAPALGPRVSVIIPARDEARMIEGTVRAWLAQRYENLEVIVVNDRSTDATEEILNRVVVENPHLIVIHGVELPAGWLGKPWALHQGSSRANGDLLLFVDADVIYDPDGLAAAVDELERHDASLLALLPYIEMVGFWENVAMPGLAFTALTMLPTWFVNRTKMPWMAIGGGTGNLVRRADYDRAGGHEALKAAVVDDIGLARLIRRHRGRTLVVRADDLVRLRMYHGGGEIVRGFTKNLFAAFGRSYLVALFWVSLAVICNLFPYAFALMGDRVSMVTVALITSSRVILFRSLRYRLDNALFGHPPMMLFWCAVALRSMWVTGVRGRLDWRGRTYDTARITTGM